MLIIDEALKNIYKNDGIPASSETVHKVLTLYFSDLDLTITNDRIVGESFSLAESICSDDDLTFGSCEASQLKITVANLEQDLSGHEFVLTQTVNDTYEMPLGKYKVHSCEKKNEQWFREIIAYDCMKNADIDVAAWYNSMYPTGNETYTLKQFRQSLLTYLGIEYEDQTLPNDDMIVPKTIDTTQLSGREVLRQCVELNGAFGQINRYGKFYHKILKPAYGLYPSNDLYPSNNLYPVAKDDNSYAIPADETITTAMCKEVRHEEYTAKEITKLIIRSEEDDIGAIVEGDRPYIETLTGTSLTSNKTEDGGRAEIVRIEGASSQVVTVQGKNCFDITYPGTALSCTRTLIANGARYTSDTASTWKRYSQPIRLSPNTTYTFKATVSITSGQFWIGLYDSTNTTSVYDDVSGRISTSGEYIRTFTTGDATFYYLRLNLTATVASVAYISLIYVQIEVGSTATSYEPFVPNSPSPDYPSPIVSASNFDVISQSKAWGRNLVRNSKRLTANTNYIYMSTGNGTYYDDNDGFRVAQIKANSTHTNICFFFPDFAIDEIAGKEVTVSAWVKSDVLKSHPEYYLISTGVFTANNTRRRFRDLGNFNNATFKNIANYKDGEWSLVIATGILSKVEEMTVASPEEDYVKFGIQFYCNNNNPSYDLHVKAVKMEFGSAYTGYSQAPEDIPEDTIVDGMYRKRINDTLRSNLDKTVRDTYEVINGELYKVQRIKEVVFDGSADEGWSLYSGSPSVVFNNTVAFRIALPDAASLWNQQGVICTHFKAAEASSNPYNNDVEVFAIDNNQSAIVRISKNRMNESTVIAFKQWLSENPITVQYELAEPIITPVSDITLQTYANLTNITTTANPQVNLTAKLYGNTANAYIIQGNFLCFGKSASELQQIARNAFGNMAKRPYTPFNADIIGLPYVEVGDYLEFANGIRGYVLQRTLTGIQALRDEISAPGSEEREQNFGVNTEIIQLKGKTTRIKKDVEGIRVEVENLEESTSTRFEQTDQAISAEAVRAIEAETVLNGKIEVNAEAIIQEVSRATQAEGELSGRIDIMAGKIVLKVNSEGKIGYVELGADPDTDLITFEIQADNINLNGYVGINNYVVITEDGKLHAVDGLFTGILTSSEFVGGVVRSDNYYSGVSGMMIDLYNGTLDTPKFYIGVDGKIKSVDGEIETSGTNGKVIIKDGKITLYNNLLQATAEINGSDMWIDYLIVNQTANFIGNVNFQLSYDPTLVIKGVPQNFITSVNKQYYTFPPEAHSHSDYATTTDLANAVSAFNSAIDAIWTAIGN